MGKVKDKKQEEEEMEMMLNSFLPAPGRIGDLHRWLRSLRRIRRPSLPA